MYSPAWMRVLGTAMVIAAPLYLCAQNTPPAPSSQAPTPTSGSSQAQSTSELVKKKSSHANDFLIRGTVFNEKGFSFPGAQLRIRRASEKKFRWESYTNSRGEFAVRVPQGADYEIVVRSKNLAEQTRTLNTKTGAREQSMVFRMEPAGEKK
jgi:carboxypeptidase family protein